jgi:hypothetical protein
MDQVATGSGVEFFIPRYPDLESDPQFTYNITRKKEFYDLRLGRSEPVPDDAGELLLSQIFMKRFFSPETTNKEGLLAHGIGTGKSCAASAIVENFKTTLVDGKPRRPALVFVTSEELARNITNEVVTVCTKDVYLARPTEAEIRKGVEMTTEARIARVNRAIAKSYEIIPMETFLRKIPSDELIKKLYSRRIIIVDEAHRFRLQPSRKKKSKFGATPSSDLAEGGPMSGILEDIERADEEENEAEIPALAGGQEYDALMMYKQMHHFLHTVEDCRKLLLTGTPIWDKSSEIASLLNLILELDDQLPTGRDFDDRFFDEDGNLNQDHIDELRLKIRGRVSFLRPMITTAKRVEEGTKVPWLKYVTVFPDAMSETQAAYAKEAREAVERKTIKVRGKMVEREVKGGTVLKTARDAMNMVLPIFDEKGNVIDVEYGPAAFKKHIVKIVRKRKKAKKHGSGTTPGFTMVQTYSIDNRFLRAAILNDLREYATKFASIIEDIKQHPKEIIFIYNEEVTGLGGAIMLGLCLEIHGFRWIKTANDIANESKQKRFAVVTSDPQTTNQPKQIQDLLASANKPDNKYGDRLQVIIGSEKIALGLTIKNVRGIHGVMPHWNIPSEDQAEGRGLRFGSQDALPENERTVRIRRHVAVEALDPADPDAQATGKGFPADAAFSAEETTDIYIYKIAEEKAHRNAQIYRLIKEEDFGCALFYNRNVLPEDVDGTRDCDYQECNYQCDGFPDPGNRETASSTGGVWDYSIPLEDLDYSTYNLLYASGRVKEIMNSIIELFNGHFSMMIDVVQQLLQIPDTEKSLLLYAVDIIINSRTLIRTRYGFGAYLKESGNMLFLDDNISHTTNYSESTYIENPMVSEITSLDALVEIIELESDKSLVQEFCQAPTADLWASIAYKTKIVLLEASYIRSLTAPEEGEGDLSGASRDASQTVLDDMGSNIYVMEDGVPVHILYTEEFKGLAYDVAAKDIRATGLMRMYDADYKAWRYVAPRQKEEEYVEEIRNQLSVYKEEGFDDNPYGAFGWISKKDGSFRINLKQEPGKKGKIRGRKCVNFSAPDLVDIFIERLEYFPEPKEDYLEFNRDELIKAIKGRTGFAKHKKGLDKKDDDYLRGLLTILTMHIDELCAELQTFFENNEILYSM